MFVPCLSFVPGGHTHYLLSSSVLALALAGALVSPGFAAETTVAGGTSVGQQVLNPDDILTINAGGTITDPNFAVTDVAAGTVSVVNNGTIQSTAAPAIYTVQSTLNLQNSGLIDGQSASIWAQNFGMIGNSGTISGTAVGLYTTGQLDTLINSGTITGTSTAGVIAMTVGQVTNSGVVAGGLDGFYADTIQNLDNSGTIRGLDSGIAALSSIGALSNSGTIEGDIGVSSDAIGTINNSGAIFGGATAVGAATIGTLVNSGDLTSGDTAVYSTITLGSLTNTGMITSTGYYGVRANDVGSIVNSGTISGTRFGFYGDGVLGSLDNSGTMTGSDYAAAADGIGTVTNSGLMQSNETALFSFGDIAAVNNTGTGRMVSKYGIDTQTNIGTVTNAGQIIGEFGGVMAFGSIGSVFNSGRIVTTDLVNGDAVVSDTLNSLTNTGTIQGGLSAIQANAIFGITNSGLIAAGDPTGLAIAETDPSLASNTLLTLNAGSVLIGHVDIHGGTNTLNVGNGLNLALTFDTSVPELIETNGSAYTVIGNTVYVADMDAFAAAGVATSELTGAIGVAAGAALDEGFDEKGLDGQGHFWLQAIGGLGHDGATDMDLRYGGLVAGADFGPDAVTRFGAFGGGSRGAVGDASAVSSFYAGVYGAGQFEDFSVKGTLTGGATEADTDRLVANNTLATGIETASSTQDAYFIAPSLTITRPWQTQDFSFETSLGLSYTGVFGQDFTENLATGLVVDGYDTHVFEAEGLIRLPFQTVLDGGTLTGDAHAGLEARAVIAPDITGSLAGAAMTLASANTQATAGAVAGVSLTYAFTGGASLFGGVDATIRTDGSAVLSANAGIKAQF